MKYNVLIELQIEAESRKHAYEYIDDLIQQLADNDGDIKYDTSNTRVVEEASQ